MAEISDTIKPEAAANPHLRALISENSRARLEPFPQDVENCGLPPFTGGKTDVGPPVDRSIERCPMDDFPDCYDSAGSYLR